MVSQYFQVKRKYKRNYLTILYVRERPSLGEEGEMKAGKAGFQSTRDERMKKRSQLRKTSFFFKQKERQVSTLIAI